MAEQIRNEFQADPIIRLIEENRSRSGLLKPHVAASADVEVLPKVSLKEAYGIDRKTGKPGKMLAVVFEAKHKPGVVWFYAKQTVVALAELLDQANTP